MADGVKIVLINVCVKMMPSATHLVAFAIVLTDGLVKTAIQNVRKENLEDSVINNVNVKMEALVIT